MTRGLYHHLSSGLFVSYATLGLLQSSQTISMLKGFLSENQRNDTQHRALSKYIWG